MGSASAPPPVKLIVGILAASTWLLEEARGALSSAIAPVELASEPRRWTESRYYCAEMGDEIWRQFVALAGLAAPADLGELKRRTNALEQSWSGEGGRRVNLDPGYIDLQKLVLASTKDAAQRVYLGNGIYAEATLRFTATGFAAWPYTYADYAAPEALAFFNQARARYRADRRTRETTPGPPVRPGAREPSRSRR